MTHDIGVGLIGFGLAGSAFHAPYIRTTPGLALCAVVSSRADKVTGELPGMQVVPTVDALLALPGIDLVVVASPDEHHAAHGMAALNAGKHVLIDKPFAVTLADAHALAARAHEQRRVLAVYQNRRWDADFRTLQRLIADGELGDIVQFESHFDRFRPKAATNWKEAREGGLWFDLGPHLVDQALVLFGRPQAVFADLGVIRDGAPAIDYFHVLLRYPERRVILHASKSVPDHSLRFAVHGTRGSWIKRGLDTQEPATIGGRLPGGDDWGLDANEGLLTRADETEAVMANERGDCGLFWQQLTAAVRGDGPNPVPPNEALLVMEVLDAGLRSAWRSSCRMTSRRAKR